MSTLEIVKKKHPSPELYDLVLKGTHVVLNEILNPAEKDTVFLK